MVNPGGGLMYLRVGLALGEVVVRAGCNLGGIAGSCGWYHLGGHLFSQLPGVAAGGVGTVPAFTHGDVVGLMVDCRGAPLLRFFVNGVQRHTRAITVEGGVWYPVFCAHQGELHVVDNPAVPAMAP